MEGLIPIIYFDGGNYKDRICFYDDQISKPIVKSMSRSTSRHSNNELEYFALIEAIKYAKHAYRGKKVQFIGDSQLVINQVWGGWRINFPHLLVLYEEVFAQLQQLHDHDGKWVRREVNKAGIHLEELMTVEKKSRS